jgi:hypothetical protein
MSKFIYKSSKGIMKKQNRSMYLIKKHLGKVMTLVALIELGIIIHMAVNIG